MADQGVRIDPFSDLLSLVSGPIAAVIRSFDQLRKGSDELMRGLENFNNTMESLNETAARVNRLLNDFEEPIRTLMPQVTRTLQQADDIASRLSRPIDQVIPGLTRLAETLNSPALTALPTDLSSFLDVINDLVRRLSPLTQIAESAGGLFGLRLPGMPRTGGTPSRPAPVADPPRFADVPAPRAAEAVVARPRATTAPARKAAPKRAATKKPAKKAAPKKAAAKKAAPRKSASKQPAKAGSRQAPRKQANRSAPIA